MPAKDHPKNRNEDKPWSEMDLFDLKNGLQRGDSFTELADFLMRREEEIEAKAIELSIFRADQEAPHH